MYFMYIVTSDFVGAPKGIPWTRRLFAYRGCGRVFDMADEHGLSSLGDFFYGAVTVGERGQVVIPADARKTLGIEPGHKLLVFRHPHHPGLVLARLDDVQGLFSQLQEMASVLAEFAGETAGER
jgi:AbrB family looped-hinge helix DNA binding protein